MHRFPRLPLLLGFLAVLGACRSNLESFPGTAPVRARPEGPYVLVLGTAQDGGLPQIGCRLACCEAARRDPSRARRVTSLLLVDPSSGRRWLIDASPDLPEQLELAADHPPGYEVPASEGGRGAPFDGIFLTHAHWGHYGGLAWLGREAYGVHGQKLYATEAMQRFLATNGPWSLTVETGGFTFERLAPDRTIPLTPDLWVSVRTVPHRAEFTDTLAITLHGPNRTLLYLPDIDKWERWPVDLAALLETVDLALVDGTFHRADEIPGRDLGEVPHPFVVETLERLAGLPASERAKLHFTHLNHTNPVADPASPEAVGVLASGFRVAAELDLHEL